MKMITCKTQASLFRWIRNLTLRTFNSSCKFQRFLGSKGKAFHVDVLWHFLTGWFSTRGSFALQETFGNLWRCFHCHDGKDAFVDAVKHPQMPSFHDRCSSGRMAVVLRFRTLDWLGKTEVSHVAVGVSSFYFPHLHV